MRTAAALLASRLPSALASRPGRALAAPAPVRPLTRRRAMASAAATAAGQAALVPTIIQAVVADHRNVSAMIQRCQKAAQQGEHEMVAALATAICVDVLMHSRAEEAVLYPFMEKKLGEEGHKFSEHSLHEHKELEDTLIKAVAAARRGDAQEVAHLVEEAGKSFDHHAHDEEDKYLPKLAAAAGEGELRELTAQWAGAKAAAGLQELESAAAKA